MVTRARRSTAMQIAGAPSSTAYSPHSTSLPGALAATGDDALGSGIGDSCCPGAESTDEDILDAVDIFKGVTHGGFIGRLANGF